MNFRKIQQTGRDTFQKVPAWSWIVWVHNKGPMRRRREAEDQIKEDVTK